MVNMPDILSELIKKYPYMWIANYDTTYKERNKNNMFPMDDEYTKIMSDVFNNLLFPKVEKTQPKMINVKPVRIIFNNPATIVFWEDGTKTVAICSKNTEFDEEIGFAVALMKRVFGERKDYVKVIERIAYRQPLKEEKE